MCCLSNAGSNVDTCLRISEMKNGIYLLTVNSSHPSSVAMVTRFPRLSLRLIMQKLTRRRVKITRDLLTGCWAGRLIDVETYVELTTWARRRCAKTQHRMENSSSRSMRWRAVAMVTVQSAVGSHRIRVMAPRTFAL